MPDILICGMEMPENEPLRLVLNTNGQLFVDHGVAFTEYEAVELPEHGDLIDRDAFIAEIKKEDTYQNWIFRKMLEKQPVIVPADKEEHNG